MASSTKGDEPEFKDRLKEARKIRELSQAKLADLSGLQQSAIGHFESGGRKPSFANVRALAKALNVSADFLLGRAPTIEGATTAFRGEENLSVEDRETIQMMIEAMNKRAEK